MLCGWCRAKLENGALVCTECSHYVHNWRNHLKYWSGIIGLMAFFASAITVVVRFGDEAYSEVFRPDLSVSDFVTFSPSSIWNLTKTDAWITTISIRSSAGGYDLQWNVLKQIRPRESYRFELYKLSSENWSGTLKELFSKERLGDFVTRIEPREMKEIIDGSDGGKYVLDFMWKNGPQYKQMKAHFGDELPEFSCEIDINYQLAIDGVSRMHQIPCVALARRRNMEGRSLWQKIWEGWARDG